VLASLAVGLLLCEIGVRVLGAAPGVYSAGLRDSRSAYRVSENPILGYEMKPGYRDADANLNATFPYINADGQRDRERTVEKPAGVRRIIVLGDSVVVGLSIASFDDMLAAQLERALGRADTEVLSFAVMGYNTRGEVELLRTKGLKYAPDLVVVVFVDNDLMFWNGDMPLASADEPWPVHWLFRHSALFRLVCLRWDLFHTRIYVDPDYSNAREEAALHADREERGRTDAHPTDDAIALLADLGRTRRFGVLIAVWPAFSQDHGVTESTKNLLGDGSDDLRVEWMARRHGLRTVRLSEAFGRDFGRRAAGGTTGVDAAALYTFDGMHPNPLGVRVAAEGIKAAIESSPGLFY
jgi:lysophospholipase L1-like esterase